MQPVQQLPPKLVRHYVLLFVFGGVFAIAWIVLRGAVQSLPIWLLTYLLALFLHAAIGWRKLADNRPNLDQTVAPTLGPANTITLLRGILNSSIAAFLFLPFPEQTPWLIALLWTISICLDLLDGLTARLTKRQTRLGAYLDLEYDSLALLIVVALVVSYQLVPPWYMLVGLARYLFVIGIWWREKQGRAVFALTESAQRRISAGLQMSFLSVVLWPIVDQPFTSVAAYAFGLPFLAIFLRDWLVVSGRLDPTQSRYLRWRRAIHFLAYRVLPCTARLLLLLMLILGWLTVAGSQPFGWLLLLSSGLVLLGIFGRIGAILLLIPLVFGDDPLLARLTMLVLTIAVINFGSGPFSVWRPEEIIFNQRLG